MRRVMEYRDLVDGDVSTFERQSRPLLVAILSPISCPGHEMTPSMWMSLDCYAVHQVCVVPFVCLC